MKVIDMSMVVEIAYVIDHSTNRGRILSIGCVSTGGEPFY